MDLNTIETVVTAPSRADLAAFREGDAWLAGGSWLFSEPQPHLRRLLDLQGFGWPALEVGDGLTIAATCRIAELQALVAPPEWRAAVLFEQCARALLGSFKVWNVATVGGNLCMALPAGPMTALAVALDAELTVWGAQGVDRTLLAQDFVLGDGVNALQPGEVLRSIRISGDALRRRTAFRQISLSPQGRSGALVIGTHDMAVGSVSRGQFCLTVTASTVRPFPIHFPKLPSEAELLAGFAQAIPDQAWHDDLHGRPDWRAHVTRVLACEILDELTA